MYTNFEGFELSPNEDMEYKIELCNHLVTDVHIVFTTGWIKFHMLEQPRIPPCLNFAAMHKFCACCFYFI